LGNFNQYKKLNSTTSKWRVTCGRNGADGPLQEVKHCCKGSGWLATRSFSSAAKGADGPLQNEHSAAKGADDPLQEVLPLLERERMVRYKITSIQVQVFPFLLADSLSMIMQLNTTKIARWANI